jgi:mono/diheme cytochrome c family protein
VGARRTIVGVGVPRRRPGPHVAGFVVSSLLVVGTVACGADAEESAAARGAGLYRANCAACHGDDLRGGSRGPSLREDAYLEDQLSDVEMASAIRNGVEERLWDFGPMPAAGGLSDAQVREIVAYVRAEQRDANGP